MQSSPCVLDYLHILKLALLSVQTNSKDIYLAANDESAALLPPNKGPGTNNEQTSTQFPSVPGQKHIFQAERSTKKRRETHSALRSNKVCIMSFIN